MDTFHAMQDWQREINIKNEFKNKTLTRIILKKRIARNIFKGA
jgi:hypothetical protein